MTPDQALLLVDQVDHQKMVIKNLQGVQEQFIKSQEKKNEQIKALREMVPRAYEEGVIDEKYVWGDWSKSEARDALNEMFPPEADGDKS